MTFNFVDNLGVPMFQADYSNPYLWANNFGNTIDIRSNVGSLGAPLVIYSINDNGIISDMTINEYIKYIDYLERGERRNLMLDELLND